MGGSKGRGTMSTTKNSPPWGDVSDRDPTELPPLPIEWSTDRVTKELRMHVPCPRAPPALEDEGWVVVGRHRPEKTPPREWELLPRTRISEPFWGVVVNK